MQPMNKIPLLMDDDLYILIYSHSLPGRLYSFTAIENDPYFMDNCQEWGVQACRVRTKINK